MADSCDSCGAEFKGVTFGGVAPPVGADGYQEIGDAPIVPPNDASLEDCERATKRLCQIVDPETGDLVDWWFTSTHPETGACCWAPDVAALLAAADETQTTTIVQWIVDNLDVCAAVADCEEPCGDPTSAFTGVASSDVILGLDIAQSANPGTDPQNVASALTGVFVASDPGLSTHAWFEIAVDGAGEVCVCLPYTNGSAGALWGLFAAGSDTPLPATLTGVGQVTGAGMVWPGFEGNGNAGGENGTPAHTGTARMCFTVPAAGTYWLYSYFITTGGGPVGYVGPDSFGPLTVGCSTEAC